MSVYCLVVNILFSGFFSETNHVKISPYYNHQYLSNNLLFYISMHSLHFPFLMTSSLKYHIQLNELSVVTREEEEEEEEEVKKTNDSDS
ncbi:hypothetical protein DERF_004435 [Dermatophagoides farinae]|uniref:Uncharacterized protein n=1 Tax=Dermatophagoides farinae TaxID=6954 RepID=A0A922I3R8_DERFA|nr:hypothetical protein DERF_004435 [Dermatophagoides farinae]